VFRKQFRAAMTVRNYRDREIVFRKETQLMPFSTFRAVQ